MFGAGHRRLCDRAAAPSEIRPLSATEQEALRKSLSQNLNDPDAAQFKWTGPAIIPKASLPMSTPIGYCGRVNGKNLMGGCVGFKRFFAQITRNAKGEYDSGTIIDIEGTPTGFFSDSTMNDAIKNGRTYGGCRGWGYDYDNL